MRNLLLAGLLALAPRGAAAFTQVQGWQISTQTITSVHISSSDTRTYQMQSLSVISSATFSSATVNALAVFNSSANFNFTGAYSLTASSSIYVSSGVYAAFFVGSAAGLTNIPAGALPAAIAYTNADNNFSTPETFQSTVTVKGNAFSVGSSTFVVSPGLIIHGTTTQFNLDGQTGSQQFTNTPLSLNGSANGYFQFIIQNNSTGANASSDLVINTRLTGNASNYTNVGQNGENFATAGTYSAEHSTDSYFYASDYGLNLVAGLNGNAYGGSNQQIRLMTGGAMAANLQVVLSTNGATTIGYGPVMSTFTAGNLNLAYGVTATTGVFVSTLTVQGNAFSVGASTFVVNGGNVIIGSTLTVIGSAFSVGGSTFQVVSGTITTGPGTLFLLQAGATIQVMGGQIFVSSPGAGVLAPPAGDTNSLYVVGQASMTSVIVSSQIVAVLYSSAGVVFANGSNDATKPGFANASNPQTGMGFNGASIYLENQGTKGLTCSSTACQMKNTTNYAAYLANAVGTLAAPGISWTGDTKSGYTIIASSPGAGAIVSSGNAVMLWNPGQTSSGTPNVAFTGVSSFTIVMATASAVGNAVSTVTFTTASVTFANLSLNLLPMASTPTCNGSALGSIYMSTATGTQQLMLCQAGAWVTITTGSYNSAAAASVWVGTRTALTASYTTTAVPSGNSWQGCLSPSTITFTTANVPVTISILASMYNNTTSDGCLVGVLIDGNEVQPWNTPGATRGGYWILDDNGTLAGNVGNYFVVSANFTTWTSLSAGSHSFCLGIAADGGGTCNFGATSLPPVSFQVQEAH